MPLLSVICRLHCGAKVGCEFGGHVGVEIAVEETSSIIQAHRCRVDCVDFEAKLSGRVVAQNYLYVGAEGSVLSVDS